MKIKLYLIYSTWSNKLGTSSNFQIYLTLKKAKREFNKIKNQRFKYYESHGFFNNEKYFIQENTCFLSFTENDEFLEKNDTKKMETFFIEPIKLKIFKKKQL